MHGDLEAQAFSLGVKQDVHFLGFRDDIPRLLAAADIFVNCSDWEGLSIAMLEAMAAGLPVLATNVGDAPSLLANGRGVLIPPQDPDALKMALLDLLGSPEVCKNMGRSARNFVEFKLCNQSMVGSDLRSIYESVPIGHGSEKSEYYMKGVRMLVNIFYPLAVGGAERQAERLATYLAFRNIPVGIITRRVGELPVYEKMGGFEVFRIGEFGSARVRSMAFIMGAILNLILHSDSFDVLHAHLAFAPAIAACIAGRLLNKAVIVKFGNGGDFGDVQELKSTWRGRRMLFILIHWADAYIALTDEMEKEMHIVGFEIFENYPYGEWR